MSLCEPPWLLHTEHRTPPLWVLPASLLCLPSWSFQVLFLPQGLGTGRGLYPEHSA